MSNDGDRRHGRHRLWDPGPVALRSAGPDRRHPRPDRPAGGGGTARGDEGRTGRSARPGGGGEQRPLPEPVVAAAPGADRCRARPLARLPLSPPGGRALIPVLMATGWSGLRAPRSGIPLNPDVGDPRRSGDRDRDRVQRHPLGALRARAQGRALRGEALRRTYLRTGAAVLASGVTAIAGFAVLAIAGLPLLDEIGLISVAPWCSVTSA